MKKIYLTFSIAVLSVVSSNAYVSEAWSPDRGNGKYINPVINADYSDPDVVGVDGDYYMTASSFCQTPGLPILHSKDLVNWTIVNTALDYLVPEEFYSAARHGKGCGLRRYVSTTENTSYSGEIPISVSLWLRPTIPGVSGPIRSLSGR